MKRISWQILLGHIPVVMSAIFYLIHYFIFRDYHDIFIYLIGGINRAYDRLVKQWLDYMEHLQGHYPYLFSLALRMNPFDQKVSPIVQ